MAKRKVGIVGFGKLGQFIADKIMNDEVVSEKLELSWVWNRSASAFDGDAGVRARNFGSLAHCWSQPRPHG